MTTSLQQQQQIQQAKTAAESIQQTPVTMNQGSVVPTVYQRNYVQEQMSAPTVKPPSQGEIHKEMWTGSFMVAVMAGLATGNAGSAIVAGMWGAIAIHDHGNALRQRAKYVNKLQADGYTFPAILDWYKTGNNKTLESEAKQMQQAKQFDERESQQSDQFNRKFDQQDTQFRERMAEQEAQQGRMFDLQNRRMGAAQSNADRLYNLQLAKYAVDMGKGAAAGAAMPDGVHAQNAAFVKEGKAPTMPPEIAAMPPQLQAAAMNAYAGALHTQGLKDIATQLSNAKNLRMGLSSPNQLFGKVEDYYKKGLTAPHNQAGDFQANQSVLGIESPAASPRANQVAATEEHMSDGMFGWANDALHRYTGNGQSDAARAQTNATLKNSFIQQASGLANEAANAVKSGGYDLNNPEILAGVVSGLGGHISGDDLKKLESGDMTPQQWAEQEADKYGLPVAFGDMPTGKEKPTQGDY